MEKKYLEIKNVTKSYSTKVAVQDVSLSVPCGSIYGLLGPNGAGKTTIIRMITRIMYPDRGEIFIDGESLQDRHLQFIGYMPEERGLYRKMKIGEQLVYLLMLKGLSKVKAVERVDFWLKKVNLYEWKNRTISELSKGMQQKIQFILTVAHGPKLLILDEPFSGLDPVNTQLIKDIILELKKEGTTTIFSTHRMEQVEEMCDYIGLIDNSQVILEDEIWNVKKKYNKNIYRIEAEGDMTFVREISGLTLLEMKNKHVTVRFHENFTAKEFLSKVIDKVDITKFELKLPGLNEIFIELVGGGGVKGEG
ncbi:MAG: ATP-binding cassette domain-containing protein [Candidatus Eremiobacterota bacterium]